MQFDLSIIMKSPKTDQKYFPLGIKLISAPSTFLVEPNLSIFECWFENNNFVWSQISRKILKIEL